MKQNEFDPGLLAEFLAESLEGIEQIPNLLIQLEENPRDESVINTIFRPIHSLKGNAAYFGLLKLKALAHDVESLLDSMRSHRVVADKEIIDLLIQSIDELQQMLLRVQSDEPEIADEQTYDDLIARVQSAGENSETKIHQVWSEIAEKLHVITVSCETTNCKGASAVRELQKLIEMVHPHKKKEKPASGGRGLPASVEQLQQLIATPFEKYMPGHITDAVASLLEESRTAASDEQTSSTIDKMIDDFNTMVSTVGFDSLLQELLSESLEKLAAEGTWKQAGTKREKEDDSEKQENNKKSGEQVSSRKSLRIDEQRIDSFLSYVGELIVVREMFEYLRKRLGEIGTDHSLLTEYRHVNESFNALSQNLQNSIMAIRKVSVKALTQKIPRIIRDIAATKEKRIRTEILGDSIEIDKSLIETLEAPLIHMVRNAADHGIEIPSVREENNKNPEGLVTVAFSEDNEHITLSIRDDGAGLDLDALKSKAVSLGLVDEKSTLSEKNIIDLLFMSGVSTAQAITDISGRGVGMDVVKQSIKQAGGVISVNTGKGQGSEFRIKLPKDVGTQIVMGMIIAVGREEYVVPLERVTETFNIIDKDITDVAGRGRCVKRRGRLLTLLELKRMLGLEENRGGKREIVVAIKAADNDVGLLVDEVRTIQQVVLKKIEGLEQSNVLFTGAAVTGSGKVAMVLDIERLSIPSEAKETAV